MRYYFLLSLIPCFSYLLYKSKKAMHMLQQNWYNDGNRYLNWVIDNYNKVFIVFDLLFVLFIFFDDNTSMIIFSCFYVIAYLIHKSKVSKEQSKKPLVITPRVKRLYFTEILLFFIMIFVMFFTMYAGVVSRCYFFIGLFIWLNWIVVLVCNFINKPIEKIVFNHYKRLAKNKLFGMTNLKRIGITGSYGKTSTKNALNDILNVKYNSFATEKSFNTMNGLMISINNKLDKFTDIFIAEMGAFRRGEIKEKCDFIKPQYGILTTIGTAHLESFGSIENTQKAKFELIDSLPSDGIAVLNMDDEYQISYKIKSKCRVVWVSIGNKKADVYASDIKLSNKGTTFKCNFKDTNESVILETKLLGNKNIYNILEAVALSYNLGVSLDQIKIGVKRIQVNEHRLELKKYGDIIIIDDAYNSNPVGSKMALEVLGMMEGKKIIVTPGMIELGDKQYEYNKEFGKYIAEVCDEVILIGEEQTKPILDGLKEKKYPEKNIHILNDVKKAFMLMRKLAGNTTYVLLENDLPDIFNE
ncbi:MAG: UDP-N-acetylmuramoyl-tripeptide--D-alanyl-D-alanine ligase [Bacilli bacterium]|nr:UDP-N-acetylmuramoyl-tripeptide--D-alanyl-D-alanine ligase [Bacilli bacterium]